jgi:hypothetical protein
VGCHRRKDRVISLLLKKDTRLMGGGCDFDQLLTHCP